MNENKTSEHYEQNQYTKEAIADAKRQIDSEETERQWAEDHEITTV